jgi:hypothetical protein
VVPLFLIVVSYLVAPVTRGSTDYSIRTVIFIAVLWGAIVLHKRRIPRLLTVRLLQDNEIVRFPLAQSIVSETEEKAVPESALELEPTKDERPSWECLKCGEENPGNFDECWKCQTWRLGKASE